jgi:hypothetical protein
LIAAEALQVSVTQEILDSLQRDRMPMNLLYVDPPDAWIEGMRVAAVAKGADPDIITRMNSIILDSNDE